MRGMRQAAFLLISVAFSISAQTPEAKIKIGGKLFRIASVVVNEPDRRFTVTRCESSNDKAGAHNAGLAAGFNVKWVIRVFGAA